MSYNTHGDIVSGGTIKAQTIKEMDDQIAASVACSNITKLGSVVTTKSGANEVLDTGVTAGQLRGCKEVILAIVSDNNKDRTPSFRFCFNSSGGQGLFLKLGWNAGSDSNSAQFAKIRMNDESLIIDGVTEPHNSTSNANRFVKRNDHLSVNSFYNEVNMSNSMVRYAPVFIVNECSKTDVPDDTHLYVKVESTSTDTVHTIEVYGLE